MGVTQTVFSWSEKTVTGTFGSLSMLRVCEFGDQCFIAMDDQGLNGTACRHYYEKAGVELYLAFDLSGRNGSFKIDLCKNHDFIPQFDIVTNYGTMEHVNDQYHAFRNMHDLCVKGGVMLHGFPIIGHWPNHGRYYYSLPFVYELARCAKYHVIAVAQAPCYGHDSDRSDRDLILAALQKQEDKFISIEVFQTLPVLDSGELTHTGDYLPLDDKRPFHLATRAAAQEVAALIPPGRTIILVDQDEFGGQVGAGHRRIPFLERDGQYWGPPPDNKTAIREFERLRHAGADFMIFGWPAFWWLEYYSEFSGYLRANFPCPLENERLVVFDLRKGK
jgi:SAM-dependent methyltransferase